MCWLLITYATPIASHIHSTTCMYLFVYLSASTPSQTLLQHPAAEFRRPKKVAWCDCDNSPPPSSPVVPLWRGMEKGFAELWRDLSDPQKSHSDSFIGTEELRGW